MQAGSSPVAHGRMNGRRTDLSVDQPQWLSQHLGTESERCRVNIKAKPQARAPCR